LKSVFPVNGLCGLLYCVCDLVMSFSLKMRSNTFESECPGGFSALSGMCRQEADNVRNRR
jgi:hypothetical protein